MLSNKDFLSLMEGKGEKKKFDLDQVRRMDQENMRLMKKGGGGYQHGQKSKEKSGGPEDDGAVNKQQQGYRDRALERRLDANPDYDPQFNIVATLNADQTKFLGGDTEHTHLVKGLDYALLRKIRKQTETEETGERSTGPPGVNSVSRGHQMQQLQGTSQAQARGGYLTSVSTSTSLGSSIQQALMTVASQKSQGFPATRHSSSSGISVLQRTAFEYDLDLLCEDDLPTTVLRSRELAADVAHLCGLALDSDKRAFIPPATLLKSLTVALENSSLEKKKHRSKGKRNEISGGGDGLPDHPELDQQSFPTAGVNLQIAPHIVPTVLAKPKSAAPVNIFDDDEVLGSAYVPSTSSSVSVSGRTVNGSTALIKYGERVDESDRGDNNCKTKALNYFDFGSRSDHKEREEEGGPATNSDLMAPVLSLLRSQHVREQRQQQLADQSKSFQLATTVKGVAHRDILGGATLGTDGRDSRGRMGDSMAAGSSYDVFPENVDFETYDSDADECDADEKSGKAKGEGKAKGDGTAGRQKSEKGKGDGSSSGGSSSGVATVFKKTNKDGAAGGSNRAERRKFAGGGDSSSTIASSSSSGARHGADRDQKRSKHY